MESSKPRTLRTFEEVLNGRAVSSIGNQTGKEDDVAAFLRGGLPLVEAESDTTTWFALRLEPTTFGIFDTFPDESGRRAHLAGRVAAAPVI
jgi:hypothetical protein